MRTPVLGVTGMRGGTQRGCQCWKAPDEELYCVIMAVEHLCHTFILAIHLLVVRGDY
jgi:hypothetical protein